MGGMSVGFLPALPVPTVTYGAVMTHDDRTGAMTGFRYGSATGGDHAAHGATPAATPVKADTGAHAGHDMSEAPARTDTSIMRTLERLLADPATRRQLMADTVMSRMLLEAGEKASVAKAAPSAKKATPKKVIRPSAKPVPKPVDPHAGHRP